MAKKSGLVLNRSGVRQLLRSSEMLQICKDYAYRAQSRLGEGYEVTYMTGKNRVNASVAAVTPAARRENSKGQTILKAVKGG